jgi:UDP-3-O-[3-hydroxymyristoyl] glucosamine N-acyltransferase
MENMSFFNMMHSLTVQQIAAQINGVLVNNAHVNRKITTLTSFENAVSGALVFADGAAYALLIPALPVVTLITSETLSVHAPSHVAVIIAQKPQKDFCKVARFLYPQAINPTSFVGKQSNIQLENNVTIEQGVVLGDNVQIGEGSVIGANSVIGSYCTIGRNVIIGPHATLSNSLIGNRVIIHTGARIGQDGFGFVAGYKGLEKMPHIGRVIIQDDVEIGANTTIDRGALDDTVIGEGTKIDNLVQIGHNVRIGRHCVITGHCGLSGSVTLGDNVMIGGLTGIADHIHIADGAQIAAASGVMNNIPAGGKWGGVPAQPLKDLFREVAIIRNFVKEKREKRN